MAPCAEHSGMIAHHENTTEAIKVIFNKLDEMHKQQADYHAMQMDRINEIGDMFNITINGSSKDGIKGIEERIKAVEGKINAIIYVGGVSVTVISGAIFWLVSEFTAKADAILQIYNKVAQ